MGDGCEHRARYRSRHRKRQRASRWCKGVIDLIARARTVECEARNARCRHRPCAIEAQDHVVRRDGLGLRRERRRVGELVIRPERQQPIRPEHRRGRGLGEGDCLSGSWDG